MKKTNNLKGIRRKQSQISKHMSSGKLYPALLKTYQHHRSHQTPSYQKNRGVFQHLADHLCYHKLKGSRLTSNLPIKKDGILRLSSSTIQQRDSRSLKQGLCPSKCLSKKPIIFPDKVLPKKGPVSLFPGIELHYHVDIDHDNPQNDSVTFWITIDGKEHGSRKTVSENKPTAVLKFKDKVVEGELEISYQRRDQRSNQGSMQSAIGDFLGSILISVGIVLGTLIGGALCVSCIALLCFCLLVIRQTLFFHPINDGRQDPNLFGGGGQGPRGGQGDGRQHQD